MDHEADPLEYNHIYTPVSSVCFVYWNKTGQYEEEERESKRSTTAD